MTREVVILDGARTAIGTFGGKLAGIAPTDTAAHVTKAAMERSGVEAGQIGHVVFGHQPWRGGPACFPHATGIDTGAVHGGGLTALVLPGKGAPHFVSVPSESHVPFRESDMPDHPGSTLALRRPGPL